VILDTPTRPKRRTARFLIPILVIVAVIAAVVVTASGEETRAQLEYLDEIRNEAMELSRAGASLREIMPRIREVDRDEFTSVLGAVADTVDAGLQFTANEPPSRALIPVWALYRQSLETWDMGVAGLEAGILQAADDPDDGTAIDVIADSLAELRVGDRIYLDLQLEFERDEIPDPVSPVVDVALSPGEGSLLSVSRSYVAAARSSTNGLGLRPGLRVSQIVSDPAWQIDVEGRPVVPSTDAIAFSVVITNNGNVASDPEILTLTLDGGQGPVTAQGDVPELAPDGQVTVVLDPLPVEAGVDYEVLVELVVTGLDSDLTDNTLSVAFTVNPS